MDGAQASGTAITAEDMSTRVLFTIFGAIHTSTAVYSKFDMDLYIAPLTGSVDFRLLQLHYTSCP